MKKQRSSSFELIRIMAMFTIIIYHIYLFIVAPISGKIVHQAILMPLHVGVPLFVMISGYFGIKPSPKGLCNLAGKVFVLTVPIIMLENLHGGQGVKGLINSFMFLSQTPFWFVRTYILLYLFSPVINLYLTNISDKRNLYLLGILGWMAVYIGTSHGDSSLCDGKNLVNFLFLYCIGNSIKKYESMINNKHILYGGGLLVLINFAIFILYVNFHDNIIGEMVWRLSYPYCSPILILNASLIFLMFCRLPIHSKTINMIAASTFSIYLIHASLFMIYGPISKASLWVYEICSNELSLFFTLSLLTIVIMSCCIIIDKFLSPIWILINRIGDNINNKVAGLSV